MLLVLRGLLLFWSTQGPLLLLVLECFSFWGWVTWSQASVLRGKHFQSCAGSWNDLSAQSDTISLFYSFVTSQIIWNSGPGPVCRVMRMDFNICWQDLNSWTNWCMNVRNFIDVLKVILLVFCKNISNYDLKFQCMYQKGRQSTGRFCLYVNVFKPGTLFLSVFLLSATSQHCTRTNRTQQIKNPAQPKSDISSDQVHCILFYFGNFNVCALLSPGITLWTLTGF